MASKDPAGRKVEEIAALRSEPPSEASAEKLKRALGDKSAAVVGKAAAAIGAGGYSNLIPDLVSAMRKRLGTDAAKVDPQCWGKNGIARALRELNHDDPAVFLAAVKHIQMEPVWGGQQDTAAELRSICAHALVSCRGLRDMELLRVLVDALADTEKLVRTNAAQAMGQVPREETALLLRLKILNGDEAPEVMGECFSALLRVAPEEGVALVSRFLDGAHDLAFEAVAALGESKEPQALERLKHVYGGAIDRELRSAALRSMGASRQPAAVDFLIELIRQRQNGQEAIAALSPMRGNEELRARVERAVEASASAALAESFRKEFR